VVKVLHHVGIILLTWVTHARSRNRLCQMASLTMEHVFAIVVGSIVMPPTFGVRGYNSAAQHIWLVVSLILS
jgi:hypothetical protein